MALSNTTNKVLKVIGIFSGAEFLKILCSIIKTKLVAIWLGAVGIGLFGIFNTTIDTITILTGLGLRQSGVREVAQRRGNLSAMIKIANILRRWASLAGISGALIMCILSPLLSQWCFGDSSHWWQFMILSGSILITSLTDGEQAIMQATDHLRNIAKSTSAGSIVGLIISIPLFRFLPSSLSIPLSILSYSLSIAGFIWLWSNKDIPYSRKECGKMTEGIGMVRLGGYMALATFASNVAQMIFIAWLNREADTAEVGLFQAGNTLVIRYTSIIFTAVGLEFYPRLAANFHSPQRMSIFVSHELSLLLKIFTPLVIIFLLCRFWIVDLLYDGSFVAIIPFISIAIISVIIRSASSCMAFTIIAKGDGKTYFFTETTDALIGVTLNILLYQRFGLFGIGVAQVLWYTIYLFMISMIYFFRYRMRITIPAFLIFLGSLGITLTVSLFMIGVV